jgi:hypothetical protein
MCRYFSKEPEYPVVVYHENHVIHPVTVRPRPTCGPPSSLPAAASVIVNSLPASSPTPADAARYPEQQQQRTIVSGGNQSVKLHSAFSSRDSDNANSNSSSHGTTTAVKFAPDFRNQLYESLDAASLLAHGILSQQQPQQNQLTPTVSKTRRSADGLYGGPMQQLAHGILGQQQRQQQNQLTKTRRSADGLYGGPMQQAAPHVADYDRGYENNRKTTCLLYLQVWYYVQYLLTNYSQNSSSSYF